MFPEIYKKRIKDKSCGTDLKSLLSTNDQNEKDFLLVKELYHDLLKPTVQVNNTNYKQSIQPSIWDSQLSQLFLMTDDQYSQ